MSTHRYAFPRLRADSRLRTGARKVLEHYPLGTGFGSTVGAALISAAAGVAGAGPVAVVTSIATGAVVGGWAGHTISRRRAKHVDAEAARRRTRILRLLKVTRMLRRRNVA